jgi:RNA polymerase sigma-70 factor (sigma-E family)
MSDISFSEFMATRWTPLYRTAYLLTGDAHDAEDLLQSALVRTCARWNRIRDKRAADGYVRTAMTNQLTNRWRRGGREVSRAEVPDVADDGGLGLRADRLALWAQVRALPPRMRAVLVLRYFEDLTVEQTAAELGCSAGAVKSQTHNAIQRLRAALPEHDLVEDLR